MSRAVRTAEALGGRIAGFAAVNMSRYRAVVEIPHGTALS